MRINSVFIHQLRNNLASFDVSLFGDFVKNSQEVVLTVNNYCLRLDHHDSKMISVHERLLEHAGLPQELRLLHQGGVLGGLVAAAAELRGLDRVDGEIWRLGVDGGEPLKTAR